MNSTIVFYSTSNSRVIAMENIVQIFSSIRVFEEINENL